MGTSVLDQVDVEPAVVVEVKEGRSGTHDLRHEILTEGTGVMDEGQAHIRCNIDKPRRGAGSFQGSWGIGRPAAKEQSAPDEKETTNGNEKIDAVALGTPRGP